MASAFEAVWQKIAAMEGEVFHTPNGVPFTYTFHRTYLVVSVGRQSVPRTYCEKIARRIEEGIVDRSPALQGQTFLLGILTDRRINPV